MILIINSSLYRSRGYQLNLAATKHDKNLRMRATGIDRQLG